MSYIYFIVFLGEKKKKAHHLPGFMHSCGGHRQEPAHLSLAQWSILKDRCCDRELVPVLKNSKSSPGFIYSIKNENKRKPSLIPKMDQPPACLKASVLGIFSSYPPLPIITFPVYFSLSLRPQLKCHCIREGFQIPGESRFFFSYICFSGAVLFSENCSHLAINMK